MLRLYGALCKQPTLETKSQTGNNRPECSGPSFWFETTALEMPAGFGRIHHRANVHAMGGRARTYGQAM